MARQSSKAQESSVPPESSPTSSPPMFGGHHDHSFTLQAVMEMRQSIGELKAAIDNLNTSVQSTKSKVDDLVNWKNRILGGALVLGAVLALLGFLVTKFSDYISISDPKKQAAVQTQSSPLPVVATTPQRQARP